MSGQVPVALPEEVARLIDWDETGLDVRVREALVVYLFWQERISSGKAAELLGISKDDFRELHQRHGIPHFRQTIDEVLKDAEVAGRAMGKRQSG